jgi:hypothetical protein
VSEASEALGISSAFDFGFTLVSVVVWVIGLVVKVGFTIASSGRGTGWLVGVGRELALSVVAGSVKGGGLGVRFGGASPTLGGG